MSAQSPTDPVPSSEREVLNTLADQFGPVLTQFFQRRVRERSEAQDLVQEVFIRLLRRGDIAALQDIRGYLFQTAASVLKDRARKRLSHREKGHVAFDPLAHGCEDFPSDRVLIEAESLTRAARALLELPDRTRAVFVLRRLEGLQYKDIARRLGISVSLVEKLMVRAVAYLAQRMGEE